MGVRDRLMHAWDAFVYRESRRKTDTFQSYGPNSYSPPGGRSSIRGNERTIISSIYNRLALDVSSVQLRHVRKDDENRFVETVKSYLNECLNVEANLDQGASAFRQDLVLSMFDEGVIAIVPIKTTLNPLVTGGYDITNIRVGRILEWYPEHVRLNVYNEQTGQREELTLPKRMVAIIQNPLYAVMNESNSTLQRIIRKLTFLDAVDEAASSGRLDLIIQLPYTIKTDARRKQAENRREDIETQLKGSKYGIAYTDGTEKITQLNRPAENNMLKQVEWLMGQLYNELGLSESVFDGTADEATMLNYNNRTVEPILRAISEAIIRTFLTKTARTQGQTIDYVRDPFRLLPLSQLADIADKFTRNEILTSNEVRGLLGFKPSADPRADKLINSNMPQRRDEVPVDPAAVEPPIELKQIAP